MRRFAFVLAIIIASTFCASSANAGLVFGTDESIWFVANITVPGPVGERLYLGRKVSMHCFLAPYSVSDEGFVLGISGEPKRYIPMPSEAKVRELQAAGYLPNPLPEWKLPLINKVLGNSLWLLLAGCVGYPSIKKLISKRRDA
jgi:hypothetical protein